MVWLNPEYTHIIDYTEFKYSELLGIAKYTEHRNDKALVNEECRKGESFRTLEKVMNSLRFILAQHH